MQAHAPLTTTPPAYRAIRFLLAVLAACVMLGTATMFLGDFLDYGAESTSIAALQRVAGGLPHLTGVAETPIHLNPYSGYFYWGLAPLMRLVGPADVWLVAFVARTVTLLLVAAIFLGAVLFNRSSKLFAISVPAAALTLLMIAALDLGLLLSIRPDLPAAFFELLVFYLAWELLFRKKLALVPAATLVGLAAALACAFRLNSLTIFLGVLIALALERRGKMLLWCAASFAAFAAALLALLWLGYSAAGLENALLMTQGEFYADLGTVSRVMERAVAGLVVQRLPLYLLVIAGIATLYKSEPAAARLYTCCLLTSYLLAFTGLLRIGGGGNYFHSAVLLGFLPAAAGLDSLFRSSETSGVHQGARVAIMLYVAALAFAPLFIALNNIVYRSGNHPWAATRAYLEENIGAGKVYASDSTAMLYLSDRILLGPYSETALGINNNLRSFLPQIEANLAEQGFKAAVIVSRTCAEWKPVGRFIAQLDQLKHLSRREGSICVFMP